MPPWYEPFKSGTSEIDWCEPNYIVSENIAEFFNTTSNVLFLVIPPLLFKLFHQYSACVTPYVNVVWSLLMVVGLGSVYFHATLSLAGQLIDEFAILWVINAAIAVWIPKRMLPKICRNHIGAFQVFIGLFTVFGTLLCCLYPKINAFVLMCFGVPTVIILIKELKRCNSDAISHLGRRCMITWGIAVSIWISDRLQCSLWLRLGFPYLHSLWHILVFFSSYQACVLFAFLDTESQYPELVPSLSYWPNDSMAWLGLPVLNLNNPVPLAHNKRPCKLCNHSK